MGKICASSLSPTPQLNVQAQLNPFPREGSLHVRTITRRVYRRPRFRRFLPAVGANPPV